MKNNKGISLTEVIITLGVLGVLASIAVVNFGSHRDPVEKRELFQSAKVWSMQVKNCLLNFSSMGGWEVRKPNWTKCPDDCLYPCEVSDSVLSDSKKNLKKKLGWDCPSDHCRGYVDAHKTWYVMDIRKEVKGTKYQVIVHFNIENQSESIYCRTNASYYSVVQGDYNSTPSYASWNANNTDKQCEWPKDSKT